ncbi:hypothetical protein pb186bvf_001596 [Paramecium bursaria]
MKKQQVFDIFKFKNHKIIAQLDLWVFLSSFYTLYTYFYAFFILSNNILNYYFGFRSSLFNFQFIIYNQYQEYIKKYLEFTCDIYMVKKDVFEKRKLYITIPDILECLILKQNDVKSHIKYDNQSRYFVKLL